MNQSGLDNSKKIKIALCGLGTVGRGLVQILQEQQNNFEIIVVFDRSIEAKKNLIGKALAIKSSEEIFQHNFDVLIECIGGIDLPLFLIREALDRKIPVITANKALLALHGYALFYKSIEVNTPIFFEAAIAGAIPIVRNLKDILRFQTIDSLQGILNGTTNYILTRMRKEKKPYQDILGDAQKLGLAEADPHLDVSGIDACQKLALLTSIITSQWIDYNKIFCRGITEISLADVQWAEKLELRIRLLARARRDLKIDGSYFLSVEPTLVGRSHFLWDVEMENNAVSLEGSYSKDHLFVGKGAGSLPTAYSMFSDLMNFSQFQRSLPICDNVSNFNYGLVSDLTDIEEQYYLRLRVADHKGVLAQLTDIFQKNDISLSRVHQDELENSQEGIDVVVITHPVNRAALLSVYDNLNKQPFILKEPMLLPLADRYH